MNNDWIMSVATLDDAQQILRLYRVCSATPGCTWHDEYPVMANIEEDISLKSLYCLRDKAGSIVGVASAGPLNELAEDDIPWRAKLNNPCELARIGIDPALQGKGLASLLMKLVVEDTQRRGFDGMHMLVSRTNPKALALYDRFGFKICGELSKYGLDFYCYELQYPIIS